MSVDNNPGKDLKSRQITRRTFLEKGIRFTGGIVAAGTANFFNIFSAHASILNETGIKEYNAEFANPLKEGLENGYEIKLSLSKDVPEDRLDKINLNVLGLVLEALPRHFYAGAKIILSNTNINDNSYKNPDLIRLDYSVINEADKKLALSFAAHEFTHRLIKGEVIANPGLKVVSPEYDKLYEILGGAFGSPPGYLFEKVKVLAAPYIGEEQAGKTDALKKIYQNAARNQRTGEIAQFDIRFIYSVIGGYYPAEILPVVTEHLLQGYDYAYKNYTDALGDEQKAKELIDLAVREVFKGRTYQSFPISDVVEEPVTWVISQDIPPANQ